MTADRDGDLFIEVYRISDADADVIIVRVSGSTYEKKTVSLDALGLPENIPTVAIIHSENNDMISFSGDDSVALLTSGIFNSEQKLACYGDVREVYVTIDHDLADDGYFGIVIELR